ncbi:MAG: signal peptidase II [Planctomycetia bacterium]|nr:signal peptidase II [Planctomycetia bacterium]
MPSSANKDDRGEVVPPAHNAGAPPNPGAVVPPGVEPRVGTSADLTGLSTNSGPPKPAVPRSRMLVFAALVVCGVSVDLATKHWIFEKMWPPNGQVLWIWHDYFGLELSLNEGALFGIGQGWVPLFVLLSAFAGSVIIYWLFVSGAASDLWLCVALGLITGGICGNLYDRLGLHGLERPPGMAVPNAARPPAGPQRIYAVRDWILFKYGRFRWPNFNIADSLLVCGAGMLLCELIFFPQRRQEGNPPGRISSAP